jgi:hypothetical protein
VDGKAEVAGRLVELAVVGDELGQLGTERIGGREVDRVGSSARVISREASSLDTNSVSAGRAARQALIASVSVSGLTNFTSAQASR